MNRLVEMPTILRLLGSGAVLLLLLAGIEGSSVPATSNDPPRALSAYYIWSLRDTLQDASVSSSVRSAFSQAATLNLMGNTFVAMNLRLPADWDDLFKNSGVPTAPDRFHNEFTGRPTRFITTVGTATAEAGDFLMLPPDAQGDIKFRLLLPAGLHPRWKFLEYTLASSQSLRWEQGVSGPRVRPPLAPDPPFNPQFPVSYFTDNAPWVRGLSAEDRALYALCTVLWKTALDAQKSQWDFLAQSERLPRPVRGLADLSKWWPLINTALLRHPWTGDALRETSFADRSAGSVSYLAPANNPDYPSLPVCTGRSGHILNYALAVTFLRSRSEPIPDPPAGWVSISNSSTTSTTTSASR